MRLFQAGRGVAKVYHEDTIAAIATPMGEGAIAVIRTSGPDAIRLLDRVFRGKTRISDVAGYTVHHGRLFDLGGEEVDEVLVTVFRSPNSYTGEDSVEVSCHGGIFVTRKVLELILECGARHAEPGEFTKRAFLNGKMDLSQAEAIGEIIAARSERMQRVSLDHLEGRFSREIRKLRDELLDLCGLLELGLDFSEEGFDLVQKSDLLRRLESLSLQIHEMIRSYRVGRVFRDGVSVAIIGKPNAGKSSLFNALLRDNRAIVNDVPGTTRDHLEETILLDGILFRLVDTAGLRETYDVVEREGVKRAREQVRKSDIFVLVEDPTEGMKTEEMAKLLEEMELPDRGILARNKSDIWMHDKYAPLNLKLGTRELPELAVSAVTGSGLDDLRRVMVDSVSEGVSEVPGIQVTSLRHRIALESAILSLSTAADLVQSGVSEEFVVVETREAANRLGEIVGDISNDEVLNNIFSKFCIGK